MVSGCPSADGHEPLLRKSNYGITGIGGRSRNWPSPRGFRGSEPVAPSQWTGTGPLKRPGFLSLAILIFNHWSSMRRYAEERDEGCSGSFLEATSSLQRPAGEFSTAALPRLVLRQRENSWQYLASSCAASLWAKFCSGDKSGRVSDGMSPPKGRGIIASSSKSSDLR
jgi:hypothetical protein